MEQIKISENLVDVKFYTSKDPYYYVVDNRPLIDLDKNVRMVAESSDSASGGADRAALSAASSAYSMLGFGAIVSGEDYKVGRGMYSGDMSIRGMDILFKHGFAVVKTDGGVIEGNPYDLPAVAVHDTITRKSFSAGVNGQTYLVQGTWRKSTLNDRVGSGSSPVMVLEITHKSGLFGVPPILDTGSIAILRVDVPAGTSELADSNITYVNYRDINQTSNPLDSAEIGHNEFFSVLREGAQSIVLNGTDIDPTKIKATEVFVEGVNQFNWNYNSVTNSIDLNSPIERASAEVVIRQTTIKLA